MRGEGRRPGGGATRNEAHAQKLHSKRALLIHAHSATCTHTLPERLREREMNYREISSEVHSTSGVPQGSVLGPLLFLLYINSVTHLLFSLGTQIYADDILLYKPIASLKDFQLLQMDLLALSQWSDDFYLTFNPTKCKFMLVSRKWSNMTRPPPLLPCNHIISRVYQFTYICIIISSDLFWSEHIHNLCMKARKMLGLFYGTFYVDSSPASLLKL